ncbi:hypothetical protein QO010_000689 [Caulobacter ginsengisoli]|uniref:DUF3768 domain-containing protein n=1 Tax=Caulobacter ginsengisoli TaxID=400775 RepID=A0ABU0ILN7_9CAUL|nr:DUF3768 domain-containing protein [Caulobacter ginsengisoli]MDQ0462941.1 hypothetical protein [Caulobacter ginsengisoli]
MTPARAAAIAAINDDFRRYGPLMGWTKFEGLWLVTSGVQMMGPQFTWQALNTVFTYDDFTPNNDPYGEHDFGCFEVNGREVFWKFDYLERGTPWAAEDPADNMRTCRILASCVRARSSQPPRG